MHCNYVWNGVSVNVANELAGVEVHDVWFWCFVGESPQKMTASRIDGFECLELHGKFGQKLDNIARLIPVEGVNKMALYDHIFIELSKYKL